MAEDLTSPIFAGRYRFEPVDDDWDRGNSGYTLLVFDLQENRLGVIKRAEATSPQATDGLKNEADALKALRGLGVPELYDSGHVNHGSKKYTYLVIEYIDGIRIEKKLAALSITERAEILSQFFGLLAQTHRRGIVNGDVDLKHLFWRRDKKEVVMIDWGNAKLGVDPKRETEFSYDLARSAEIIFSLVTSKGDPPVTGSLSLPNDSELIPNLIPLPEEYYKLCEWAPRAPSEGAKAPYTALELYGVSKKWRTEINDSISYKRSKPKRGRKWLLWASVLLIGAIAFMAYRKLPGLPFVTSTASVTPSLTATATEIESIVSPDSQKFTETPSPTASPTESPTATTTLTPTQTATQTPAITPSPRIYSDAYKVLVFDKNYSDNECWLNEAFPTSNLEKTEGFTRRDDGYWKFGTQGERPIDEFVQTEFSQCFVTFVTQEVRAIALNIYIPRLEPKREIGFFIEDANGKRREYTLWVDNIDNVDRTYIRLRENTNVTDYEKVFLNNLTPVGTYPRPFYQFAIQLFFEIDNDGFDILYLREGPAQPIVKLENMDPNEKERIDNAVFPTLSDIQKMGLVGYGGKTEIAIWPLAFYAK